MISFPVLETLLLKRENHALIKVQIRLPLTAHPTDLFSLPRMRHIVYAWCPQKSSPFIGFFTNMCNISLINI
ncbi:hypothetical protein LSAT2_004791 [Lamellibrachia satsuma]|nr:hypothetical protein LSAT2_004791 [Lamellibrachia satsuma]